jgi:hypothetical protein
MLVIRSFIVLLNELCLEADRRIAPSVRKVVAAAVVSNPLSGQFVQDLSVLIEAGEDLGKLLADSAVTALGVRRPVVSYGKVATVGLRGEPEHAAPLLHPRPGKSRRTAIGHGVSIVPSVTKRAAVGARIDIPLHREGGAWGFEHHDAVSLTIPDAPMDDEIVIAVALADGGRPLAQVGRAHEISHERVGSYEKEFLEQADHAG